jgi:hypothetical protein
MTLKSKKNIAFGFFAWSVMILLVAILVSGSSSCGIYKFNEAMYPDSIKTVRINPIENRALYKNNQLAPRLYDKLRQKIISQTKLTQTNNDNVDWEITAYVTDYNFTTSAISNQEVSGNQLTVSVHITLTNHKADEVKDHDVSRNFEFKGNLSFDQASNLLLDEITRTLTDEIFNKLFSNW